MTDVYPDSSTDEDEIDDFDGGEFRGSIDSRVTIDSWQNQRYKPLQGGWCRPFTEVGVPYFSDLSGAREIAFTTRESGDVLPEVKLKEGWSFFDEWEVDKSGAFGEVDEDGWSYATSFETLFEQTSKRTLLGEMGRMSLVRRRRWVRVKTCVDMTAKAGFKELVGFNDHLRLRLGMLSEKKADEYSAYQEHFHARSEQVQVTLRYASEAAGENINILTHVVRKLKFVKEFLVERGSIEAAHAQALHALSEKWKDHGGVPTEIASDIQEATGEKGVQKKGEQEPGFFMCITSADSLAASRMDSFSLMLTESLPADVEAVLDEANVLLHDCLSEDISKAAQDAENKAQACFGRYKAAIHAVRVTSATESARLQSTLHSVSAADTDTGGGECSRESSQRQSREGEAGSVSGSTDGDSYALQVQRNDTYVSLRSYRQAVVEADSLITMYSAFVRQQRKKTRMAGIRIQALLRAMVKMCSHELKRLWEDTSADLMRLLGDAEQARALQRQLSLGRERSVSGISYAGDDREEVAELCNPQFPSIPNYTSVAKRGLLRVAVTKVPVRTAEEQRVRSRSSISLIASTSPPPTPSSSSQKDAGTEVVPVWPEGSTALTECDWEVVAAVVTHDSNLLLFRPHVPSEEVNPALAEEEATKDVVPWRTLSLVKAAVEPIILAGGDAFAVKLKQGTFAFMVGEGEGPTECVRWMRVISNPIADPAEEPPGEGGGDVQM